jgi:predicted nucleotidyltransferase
MNEVTINKLKLKNKELIDIVTQKVRNEYEDDIDLIGICGSFFTGDFHEKSDLDLLVVLNNDRGWGFSKCFILDDIGYDFYGSTWAKLEDMAKFDNTFVSHAIDVDIVYSRNNECIERFMKLREKALNIINGSMNSDLLKKTKKHIDAAILSYGQMMLEDEIGIVRKLSGDLINSLNNTVCYLNHNYFKLGVKHQLEELIAMERVPKNFERSFNNVILAKSVVEIKQAAATLIKVVRELYDEIAEEIIDKPVLTKDSLKGTYEEIWSNCRNKIQNALEHNDIFLAFSSGVSCQNFYDEMHINRGTALINLMKDFQAEDLERFSNAFSEAMEIYRLEYDKQGMQVAIYESIDEFKEDYLGDYNL